MHLRSLIDHVRRVEGFSGLLKLLTVDQWDAIDRDYRVESPRVRLQEVAIFFTVAVILTLQKYLGSKKFFDENLANLPFLVPLKALLWPNLLGHLYWAWFSIGSYMLIPMALAWTMYREKPSDYGFSLAQARHHVPIYGLMFLGIAPLVVLASGNPEFLARYPFYAKAGNSWGELLLWEFSYGMQFVALEYFFRGFMLVPLARHIGAYAIFAMVVPYCMLHFAKPLPETVGSILAGTILGTLALRTRSVFGGVLIHVAVAWSMDLLALWRKGSLAGLLN